MSTAADYAAQRAVLDRVGSLEREAAVLYAKQARARAEMAALWGTDQGQLLELAGTARIGQARAGGQLGRAERLVGLFPIALGLLELGVMRVGTVEILLSASKNCTEPVQRLLDARLAERVCPLDAVDVSRLVAATIPELEAELDPDAQEQRLEQARANRGVWVFPVDDGMARIGAEVDQMSARRFALDLAELVRAQKVLDDREGIKRTKKQREADVLCELPSRLLSLADSASRGCLDRLLATALAERSGEVVPEVESSVDELPLGLPPVAPGAWWQRDCDELVRAMLTVRLNKPAVLNVHLAMTTSLDLDQRSGWLEGFGPIPALHGRMLLATAELRRVAVDRDTGVPLGMDPLTGPLPPWPGEIDPPDAGRHRRRWRLPEDPAPCDPVQPPSIAQVQRGRLLEMIGRPMYLTEHAEPQHDPSRALRDQVIVRDQLCDGPGCPRTASACELDHEQEYARGGQTAIWNLKARSTRCHHRKHDDWAVDYDPCTGISTWTSPAGGVYERRSAWQPPPPLPEDLVLPEPRLVHPIDLRPDRYDADSERPLWREPEPPRPRAPGPPRGIDPDDIDEHGNVIPTPSPPAGTGDGWYDDGPPPF